MKVGEYFDYISGVVIDILVGNMEGYYVMELESGECFCVFIDVFWLVILSIFY